MTDINIDADVLRRALDGDDTAQKEARNLLGTTEPSTGLMGRWVTHPDFGEVMIISNKVTGGKVYVHYLDELANTGTGEAEVYFNELTFPEQTTRPEDVPVGEAWLVNIDHGTFIEEGIAALKGDYGWHYAVSDLDEAMFARDKDIDLIAPLVPAEPTDLRN